jgi:hypothetical protein
MKKFIAPLQAFIALFLCSGMAWMIFVLASINPTPPTVLDLQARNTQDLSFASMNSTAVALAKQMIAEMAPTSSGILFLPVTGRETATPALAAEVTLKPVFTAQNTATPSVTPIPPTATRKKTDNAVPTLIPTQAPTKTQVSLTATRVPNTKQPTSTPVTPTAHPPTATSQPTNALPTATPAPPTDTPPANYP